MATMPRLAVRACTTLACAGLLLSSGTASSGATDECSESYKICNGGCARRVNDSGAGFCRMQCDYRLIACDQQSAAAWLTQGRRQPVSRPSER